MGYLLVNIAIICNALIAIISAQELDKCNENSNVICIGLGTFGQSLCRKAIASNLTILNVFDMYSSPSQPITQLFNINKERIECYANIQTSNMKQLSEFISKYNDKEQKSITALIGVSSGLDSLDTVLPIIKQCLSNSINVITIMTPQLSLNNLNNIKNNDILRELHKLAIENNVYFKSSGLSSFLYKIFPFEIMKNQSIEYKEIIGRVRCNADYIAYIHRNEKPNVWFDWFIGERINDYYDKATTLKFYKLLQNELNIFTKNLLSIKEENEEIINNDDWFYTFNSKAIYDQHGETASAFLNRIIETGRITSIRYNARLINIENNDLIHIIFNMGLFKDKSQRELLTPCHIQWTFLNEDGDKIGETEIGGIDIIAAMMHDAVENINMFNKDKIECGICCNIDENKLVQDKCLLSLSNNIKSEL